ncbi:MAG: type II secretion system protein GspM [Pseudomonadota bacterium]
MNDALTASPLLAHVRTRWQRLPTRAQRALALGGAVTVCALLWSVVWHPAWTLLTTAPARQMRLQQALAAVQRDAAELAARRRQPDGRAQSPAAAQATPRLQSLSAATLGDSARVTGSPQGWDVAFETASADGLAQWLAGVRTDLGLRVTHLQADRDASTGSWRGTARLSAEGQP